MCREILFKAKQKNFEEWREGYLVKVRGKHYIFSGEVDPWARYENFTHYEVDPDTICQFTGLHDKIGKKIWEHDIVKFENAFSSRPHIGKVRYYAGAKPISDDGKHSIDLAECNAEDLTVLQECKE